jgi:uncharacterized protein
VVWNDSVLPLGVRGRFKAGTEPMEDQQHTPTVPAAEAPPVPPAFESDPAALEAEPGAPATAAPRLPVGPETIGAGPQRLDALDLIRGVAILGILAMNIGQFSSPGDTPHPPGLNPTPWDVAVVVGSRFFVDTKFITLLSLLFGMGLALQYSRAETSGFRFTGYYVKRMALLFVLGIAHAVLLWEGDILNWYAAIGILALLFASFSQRALLWTVAGLMSWSYLSFLGLVLVSSMASGAAPQDLPPDSPAMVVTFMNYFSAETAIRIFQEGSYGQMVTYRLVQLLVRLPTYWIILGSYTLGCFLLGLYLIRAGYLRDPAFQRKMVRRCLLLAALVGVPFSLAAARWMYLQPENQGSYGIALMGAVPMSLGYLAILTLWSESGRGEWLQSRLRAVGRLALTNYLMQTVICTTLFYSYGFGWYARVGRAPALLIVLAIWGLQLALSPVWLRYFQIGPVEWVWRSLADGRVRPLLRKQEPPTQVLPPEGQTPA